MKRLILSDRFYYVCLVVVYILFFVIIGRHLIIESLWYDEAGQVFISFGLNHWSDPYSPHGGLSDIIYSNSHYNMDPGGYSLLLRLWMIVSADTPWVRMLSFVFYVGAMIFSGLITYKTTGNKKVSWAAGLLVLCLINGAQAVEVRAYSMELCGTAYGIWMILWLRERLSLRRILLSSLLLSFFITSRYTMVVIGFVYSCFVLVDIARSDSRNKVLLAVIYTLPLLFTVGCIYYFSMRIQNGGVEPLSYVLYIEKKPGVIVFWIVAITMLAVWRRLTPQVREIVLLFWIVNVLFVVLGYLKMLPWNLTGNKGGVFMLLFYIALYNSVLSLLRDRIQQPIVTLGLVGVILAGMAYKISCAGCMMRYYDISELLRREEVAAADTVYVYFYASPEVRYLMEYGSMRAQAAQMGYPERFDLPKGSIHCVDNSEKLKTHQRNFDELKEHKEGSIVIFGQIIPDSMPDGYSRIPGIRILKKEK